jgi:hypothetical protein
VVLVIFIHALKQALRGSINCESDHYNQRKHIAEVDTLLRALYRAISEMNLFLAFFFGSSLLALALRLSVNNVADYPETVF